MYLPESALVGGTRVWALGGQQCLSLVRTAESAMPKTMPGSMRNCCIV